MRFTRECLEDLDSRRRAALVNSVSGYKSANLVGTCDDQRHPNLAIMSSAVHLGSHPPLMMLVLRPTAARQHTLANILATGHYTLNHVTAAFFREAHQTAARYPRETSEFTEVGLTPLWLEGINAPFVAEAPVRIGLELREHKPLDINGTHLLIGEITCLEIPSGAMLEDGSLDLVAAGSVAISGLDTYLRAERLGKLPYAKPAAILGPGTSCDGK